MKVVSSSLAAICVFFAFTSVAVAKNAHHIDVKRKNGPLYTYKGDAFAAAQLPPNIVAKINRVQAQLNKNLFGSDFSPVANLNLHITLQVMGTLNTGPRFFAIHQALRAAANHNRPLDLAKHTGRLRLRLHQNGLVSIALPHSDSLTRLAVSTRGQLKRRGIKHSRRFDFPDHGHITIGKLKQPPTQLQKNQFAQALRTGKLNMKVMRAQSFRIPNFALLKSNNPQPNRSYARLAYYSLRSN